MTGTPRVLVVSPFYPPAWRGGGPIRTLAAMVAQHGDTHHFAVLTSAYDWGEAAPMAVPTDRWIAAGKASVRYLPVAGAESLASPVTLAAWVRAWREATSGGAPDVTYLTGVFPPVWSILPLAARRVGLLRLGCVLIAPRGELSAGALALKAGKKRRYLRLAKAAGLFRGVVWHASTGAEAADIDQVVPGARVVVRENETELPARAVRPGAPTLTASRPGRPGPRHVPLRIVYLGRLSPKKGVHLLLEALRLVTCPVEVTVAGSAAEPAYLDRLRVLAAASPHPVRFLGGVERERVPEVLRAADVFVFPTVSENFGHSVAEALSVSVPVMLARGATPWPQLLGERAADALVLVDGLEPAQWAAHIDRLASRSVERRRAARNAAADAYDAWRSSRPRESVFELLPAGTGPGRG